MTNTEIESFRMIFMLQATVLKFCDFLVGSKFTINAKFQHNILKIMPASPKNTGT